MAGTGVVTSAKSYEPPSSVTYGLRIYREGVADDSKFNLYLKDDSANGTRLLEIDHYGAGASQSFALDIHNYPGARSALVVHQYSALSERSNSTTPPIRRWPSCIIPRINALTGNQCRRLRLLPVGGIRESENIHRWRNDVWQSDPNLHIASVIRVYRRGRLVSSPRIPYRTYIQSLESPTWATMSANATATNATATVKIYRGARAQIGVLEYTLSFRSKSSEFGWSFASDAGAVALSVTQASATVGLQVTQSGSAVAMKIDQNTAHGKTECKSSTTRFRRATTKRMARTSSSGSTGTRPTTLRLSNRRTSKAAQHRCRLAWEARCRCRRSFLPSHFFTIWQSRAHCTQSGCEFLLVPYKDEPLITRIGGTRSLQRRPVPPPRYPKPGRQSCRRMH
jgi:hypothetical protein